MRVSREQCAENRETILKAAAAHARMEAGDHVGKIVLEVQ